MTWPGASVALTKVHHTACLAHSTESNARLKRSSLHELDMLVTVASVELHLCARYVPDAVHD